ncbi:MAG: DUF2511 domain-containing protein [Propionibacteriaceae bacterium]|nr:DUF2511 domain-containing protein [Propionibacteriaceae bacterium]
MRGLSSVGSALVAVLMLAACSSGPVAESTPVATLSESEMIAQAEKAVVDSLPDAPIWEGMTVKGHVVDGSTVCVDRTWRPGGGLDGKGGNAGYVMVTFPDLSRGEPQDGLCVDAKAPTSTDVPAVEVPDDVKGKPGLITRSDLGADWPLTVDYGILQCRAKTSGGRELKIASFVAPDGTEYALNGHAKADGVAEIDPMWADNPKVQGLKIDISPLTDRALGLC